MIIFYSCKISKFDKIYNYFSPRNAKTRPKTPNITFPKLPQFLF